MDLVEARVGQFEDGPRHPWERARLTLVSDLIARHTHLAAGDTVIDIGCGDVFVVEALSRRYPDVRFHAVDSAFTEQLIATLKARVHTANISLAASLDQVRLAAPPALVLLMDVIEHVPDDRAFLQEIIGHGLIGPETRVLITVPSYPALMSAHDVFLGHYRRYTRAMLRTVVESLRLRVVEDGHFFTTLALARAVQTLRERVWAPNQQSGVGLWSGGDMLGRVVTTTLAIDGRIGLRLGRLGVPVPGLSNFAICQRSP